MKDTPWKRPLYGAGQSSIAGPFTESLELISRNQIYIPKDALPPASAPADPVGGVPESRSFTNAGLRLPTYDKLGLLPAPRITQARGLPRGCWMKSVNFFGSEHQAMAGDERNPGLPLQKRHSKVSCAPSKPWRDAMLAHIRECWQPPRVRKTVRPRG